MGTQLEMQDKFSEQNVKMTNQILFTTLLKRQTQTKRGHYKGKRTATMPLAYPTLSRVPNITA